MWGWIDTPGQNYPPLLPKNLVPIAFSLYEKLNPNETAILFTDSLNKKLGTTGLDIAGIQEEAEIKHGANFSDVMGWVEKDGWNYTGFWHDGESMVCSSFVVALWKSAGLFDEYTNAVEWSPKDVYQVDFFNKTYDRPQ